MQHASTKLQQNVIMSLDIWSIDDVISNKCESLHPSIPDENQKSPKTISNSEEDEKYPS